MKTNKKPSRRQIVFNWLMSENTDATDGYWGTSDEVSDVDELLTALDKYYGQNK